jgi:integrase/recombinase XerC
MLITNIMGGAKMEEVIKRFREYLEAERNLSHNTVSAYLSDIDQFMKHCEKPLTKITPADISTFLVFLRNETMCAATRGRKLSTLKTFFRFMVRKDILPHNPADSIEGPKIPKRLPKPIDEADVDKILHFVDNMRDRALMEILYGGGLRREEVATLKATDFNFNYGFVRVMGKGGKERFVPLHSSVLELVKAHLVAQKSVWVFPGRKENHLSLRQVNEVITKWRDKAGMGWVTPHKYRHSFATHLYNNGADIKVIQDLLGHENANTTQVYTQVSNERNRKEYLAHHPRSKIEGAVER